MPTYGEPLTAIMYRKLQFAMQVLWSEDMDDERRRAIEGLCQSYINLREHFVRTGLPYYYGELPEGVPDPRTPLDEEEDRESGTPGDGGAMWPGGKSGDDLRRLIIHLAGGTANTEVEDEEPPDPVWDGLDDASPEPSCDCKHCRGAE